MATNDIVYSYHKLPYEKQIEKLKKIGVKDDLILKKNEDGDVWVENCECSSLIIKILSKTWR